MFLAEGQCLTPSGLTNNLSGIEVGGSPIGLLYTHLWVRPMHAKEADISLEIWGFDSGPHTFI
jgi:hypothetical protein